MPYDGTLPRVSLPQLLYLLPPILPDRRLPKIYLERARESGVLRLTPRCEPVTRETAGAGPQPGLGAYIPSASMRQACMLQCNFLGLMITFNARAARVPSLSGLGPVSGRLGATSRDAARRARGGRGGARGGGRHERVARDRVCLYGYNISKNTP